MPLLVLIMVLGLSIGYSAFVSKVNISKIVTEVRLKEDIRITGVSVVPETENDSSPCSYTTDSDGYEMVTCGEENFYIIEETSSTVTALSKYNLTLSTTSPIQDTTNAINGVAFSSSRYWCDSTNLVYTVDANYASEGRNYPYVYNSSSNLYPYIEAYREVLEGMKVNVIDAKLLSYEQALALGCTYGDMCSSGPSWVGIGSYWLGSTYIDPFFLTDGYLDYESYYYGGFGVRPVITISKSSLGGGGIQNNGGISNYEEYNIYSISTGINLPNEDSSVTYKVEVTNYGNVEMGILDITGLPSNLQYQLTDYTLKDKICDSSNTCKLGINKEFYITIKYKSNGYIASSTDSAYTYDLNLDFNFQPAYSVTYTDITNNGYPTTILGTDTLEVDFGSSAPSAVKVLVGGTETTNYTYTNGVLTVPNVTGDVEIAKGFEPVPLITYLTELYTPNSTVKNNSITYNIDTTNRMIDDGLGGTVSSGGNIRYYGPSASVNNYIDIGDRDSSGNVILWRIIGLFKDIEKSDGTTEDLVKIIRAESIGKYSWDYTSSGDYDNNWSNATLKTMLNGAYYNSTSTSYYNNSATATTVDFTSSGLSSSAREKVENVVWNLGGLSSSSSASNYYKNLYSEGYYKWERGTTVYSGRPTEWTGKIGLMYPSDYGYATDFTKCNQTLYNYSSSTDSYACRTNDWLYNSSIYQWTITPSSIYSSYVFFVGSNGYVNGNGVYAYGTNIAVRPVLYLKSDVVLEGEYTGTSTDPYMVSGGSTATSTG